MEQIKIWWCKLWHSYWQKYEQITYGGEYYVTCSKCGCKFLDKR